MRIPLVVVVVMIVLSFVPENSLQAADIHVVKPANDLANSTSSNRTNVTIVVKATSERSASVPQLLSSHNTEMGDSQNSAAKVSNMQNVNIPVNALRSSHISDTRVPAARMPAADIFPYGVPISEARLLESPTDDSQSLSAQMSSVDAILVSTHVQWIEIILNILESSSGYNRTHKEISSTQTDSVSKNEQEKSLVSATCLASTKRLMGDMMAKQPYAIKALDSVGKLPSGILEGDYHWWGDYDECRSIFHTYDEMQTSDLPNTFKGQYCLTKLIRLKPDVFKKPEVGICVPAVCTEQEVTIIANAAIISYMPFTRAIAMCEEDFDFNAGSYIAICMIAVAALCVLLGTSYDIINTKTTMLMKDQPEKCEHGEVANGEENISKPKSKNSTMKQLLNSCSCMLNGTDLLRTKVGGRDSYLSCLNGMRVLSLWWVVILHSVVFQQIATKNDVMEDLRKRFTFQIITQGTLSVDTFFFMSGLLVAFLHLKQLQKGNGKINWIMFYVHRFCRLTPLYAFVLVFYIGLMEQWLYDGPYSRLISLNPGFTSCYEYWWTNLLYINNLVPKGMAGQCMGWAWYLANDMQFFVISPIFIYTLYRWRRVGFSLLMATLLFSLIYSGVMASEHNQTPLTSLANQTDEEREWFMYMYAEPYYRIPPYLVGMVMGYVFYKTKGNLNLKWYVVLLGWAVSTTLGMLIVYGFHPNYKNSEELPQWAASWYMSCGRFAFSLSLAWVTFACGHGYGGPITTFLSWRVWLPLSKLNYAAYLIHPIIIICFYVQYKIPMYYTDISQAYLFTGHLVMSYAVSVVATLLIEMPMAGLEKIAFRRWK